ncbi:hypothetical protein JAAARDRAFT_131340 [Jaapia argillacea MUCL 33604]|uniref:ATP-dependent DNA helicase n=1 Tax=Jaapia argillacea MUCL 33604 TaxID=933084 RepID=A0A067PSY6_9AGAM|nr:hypothetical protein JAAARDRAFT_131340 [Jaapia argillacea MUCL 33604]
MFDVVRNIVERKSEFLNGTFDSIERGRRLLTQITNAFMVKMEIGAPMAALFLMGKNDHYTNCKFKTFYWKSFVKEALKDYHCTSTSSGENNDEDMQSALEKERIVIQRSNEEYSGISPVMDDIFWLLIYEACSLYDWMQLYQKEKIPNNLQKRDEEENDDNQIENYELQYEDECQLEQSQRNHPSSPPQFLEDHPQYNSHYAFLRPECDALIPNFVGKSLLRSDKGSKEFYSSVMLILFKPWRSGKDLKLETQEWKSVFEIYNFTDRQHELMKYFNVRYECNDARDDFSAQRHKLNGIPSKFFDESDSANEMDFDTEINTYTDLFTTNDDRQLSQECYGKHAWNKMQDMNHIQNVLELAGWNSGHFNDTAIDHGGSVEHNSSINWASVLSQKKAEVLAERAKVIAATNQLGLTPNDFRIVESSFLTKSYKASNKNDQYIIDSIVTEFSLNGEQERAFRIVANHAIEKNNEQLNMHLGGMGSTGKSQVIKALLHFFTTCEEKYKFVVLAPTGSAAAIIDGSTYHSMLGIRQGSKVTQYTINDLKERLEGVKYIFIDEISMLSCKALYNISRHLAMAFDNF